MARYTGPSCRLCRREGKKLFLKGDRCYSEKCALARRPFAPGQHGQGRAKTKEYGLMLREKQMTKRFYGLSESQFRKYFEMATKKDGVVGENLLILLETRLDNVVYRLGLAMSRAEARQLVRHAHFSVNGKKVNIPSYLVKAGDVIAVRENSRSSDKIKAVIEANASKPMPGWLEFNASAYEGKLVAMPTRADIDLPVEEHLIVELYSK
ncbi:MAG: 30S ribosomal protein S4 [Clostridia bacterium]|nr:30S ribosomal protein S4 [Clostridia bacterium]